MARGNIATILSAEDYSSQLSEAPRIRAAKLASGADFATRLEIGRGSPFQGRIPEISSTSHFRVSHFRINGDICAPDERGNPCRASRHNPMAGNAEQALEAVFAIRVSDPRFIVRLVEKKR